MTPKNLTEWVPELISDIPEVTLPALLYDVRNACIIFCEKTLLWKEDLDRITVVADQSNYTLTAPDNSVIISIDDVKYKQDGEDDDQFTTLTPASENQMDLHSAGSWKYRESSTPSKYWVDKDRVLYLLDIPTEASEEGLLVRVNLKPTRSCTTVEEFLYNDHFDAIAHGAKALLFSRKALPWYDPKLALEHETRFQELIDNAKGIKTDGYTKRPRRVKMRDFLGGA